MKAIVLDAFGAAENFSMRQLDTPVAGAGQVLVQIKAAAFNPIDYQMRKGLRESARMHSPVLGREFSGIVEATGNEIVNFKPGDEVFAASGSMGSNGTYAEYITLPYEVLAHKPAGISFEEAAAVPVAGLTAWQCFKRLHIDPLQRIFITGGAGGVGAFLIKLLKAHQIHQIVTTAGNTISRNALLELGLTASQIIDYKAPELLKKVTAVYPGQRFDFSVDLVGGLLSEIAAEVLKLNGIYADVTFLATENARGTLFDNGATIVNVANYAYSLAGKTEWFGEQLDLFGRLFTNGSITAPLITIVGDLSAASVKQAHLLMENNQTNGRKVVMRVE
jgi:NADPH:quinone reductase-like Zn-dependent oxidoreductase